MIGTYRMAASKGGGLRPVTATSDDWSAQLAPRLFAPPARWGWQAAVSVPAQSAAPPMSAPRPAWVEPPRPDTSALVAARSKAVTRVIRRLAFFLVAAAAFLTYQLVVEQQVNRYGNSAHQLYKVVLIVVAALVALGVIRAIAGVRFAGATCATSSSLTSRCGPPSSSGTRRRCGSSECSSSEVPRTDGARLAQGAAATRSPSTPPCRADERVSRYRQGQGCLQPPQTPTRPRHHGSTRVAPLGVLPDPWRWPAQKAEAPVEHLRRLRARLAACHGRPVAAGPAAHSLEDPDHAETP